MIDYTQIVLLTNSFIHSDKSSRLFLYLKNKSDFEHFYRHYLEKRLLSPNIFWTHKENYVIEFFSVEHDIVYAKQLERMIKDIQDDSVKLREKFVFEANQPSMTTNNNNQSLPFDIRLNILHHLAWDKFGHSNNIGHHNLSVHNCNQCLLNVAKFLPKSFSTVATKLCNFYQRQHKEPVKLDFCLKYSWAEVQFFCPMQPQPNSLKTMNKSEEDNNDNKVLLVITAAQLMVLNYVITFNNNNNSNPSMIIGELKKVFFNVLTMDEFNRSLRLLIHFKIFQKISKNENVETKFNAFHDQDVIIFNPYECIKNISTINKSSCSLTNITTTKGSSLEVMITKMDNTSKR